MARQTKQQRIEELEAIVARQKAELEQQKELSGSILTTFIDTSGDLFYIDAVHDICSQEEIQARDAFIIKNDIRAFHKWLGENLPD